MQENISLNSETELNTIAARSPKALPIVPFVRILSINDPLDCPFDRYILSKKMAKLEYSKNNKGGQVISLDVLLRSCPECERLYIDQKQVLGLKNVGLDIRGFDIIGSNTFPRTKGYEKWHPNALKTAVAILPPTPKPVRKPRAKKVKAVEL